MTIKEIGIILERTQFPVSYRAFPENHAPPLPFICFLETDPHNFAADGIVYHSFTCFQIELYTKRKDPKAEAALETVLTDAEIFYEKSETYIESEKAYQITYEIEV